MEKSKTIMQSLSRTVASAALMPFLLPLLPIVALSWICYGLQEVRKGAST